MDALGIEADSAVGDGRDELPPRDHRARDLDRVLGTGVLDGICERLTDRDEEVRGRALREPAGAHEGAQALADVRREPRLGRDADAEIRARPGRLARGFEQMQRSLLTGRLPKHYPGSDVFHLELPSVGLPKRLVTSKRGYCRRWGDDILTVGIA